MASYILTEFNKQGGGGVAFMGGGGKSFSHAKGGYLKF